VPFRSSCGQEFIASGDLQDGAPRVGIVHLLSVGSRLCCELSPMRRSRIVDMTRVPISRQPKRAVDTVSIVVDENQQLVYELSL
jgi:hypothetical protein